jgi:SAM-dependent methyltransferase
MGVSAATGGGPHSLAVAPPAEVVWHDLECGSYSADMALWRELAQSADPQRGSEPILDVGAGTGRVTLDLARRGHSVTALDIRPELLAVLKARAGGLAVEAVCADARALELPERGYALVLMPMQTLQLLGGAGERGAFFARARAHMRPGALLACAIVTDLEPFDCGAGDLGPSPETVLVAGRRYISRATRVRVRTRSIAIERERLIIAAEGTPEGPQGGPAAPSGAAALPEHNVVELDRVSVARLAREGSRAGLTPAGTRETPATEEHVGSAVVMFRA